MTQCAICRRSPVTPAEWPEYAKLIGKQIQKSGQIICADCMRLALAKVLPRQEEPPPDQRPV